MIIVFKPKYLGHPGPKKFRARGLCPLALYLHRISTLYNLKTIQIRKFLACKY